MFIQTGMNKSQTNDKPIKTNNLMRLKRMRFCTVISMLLIFLIALAGCAAPYSDEITTQQAQNTTQITEDSSNGVFKVTFLDVGQADCILLQRNSKNMLIDSGDVATRDYVVNYLKDIGIEKIDIVVGTHPHSDHIGAMDKVIKGFDIGTIYMPKASNNTNVFNRLLDEIEAKSLKVTTPIAGSNFKLDDVEFKILAPNSDSYQDLNDYSIVLLAKFGENKFIFTGDAEVLSEDEIVAAWGDISADVLKVGHHGSYTSNSQKFLDAVNPTYAVITCGFENSYGHPHDEVMQRLKNIQTYRTDLQGEIIAISDGKDIEFSVLGESIQAAGSSVSSDATASYEDNGYEAEEDTKATEAITYDTYVDAQGNGTIKGNLSSSGEKIYHMPGGLYYDRTVPEHLFKTEQEAIDAGFRKSKR